MGLCIKLRIPEIFTKPSLLHSGYRLLRRYIRHSFDSKCESIDNQTIKLIFHKGKLGLVIKAPIPASMESMSMTELMHLQQTNCYVLAAAAKWVTMFGSSSMCTYTSMNLYFKSSYGQGPSGAHAFGVGFNDDVICCREAHLE